MRKSLLFGMILTVCVLIVAFVFSLGFPGGMISYCKFDEESGSTAIDSVNGNPGTIFGAVRTTGQVGGALSFNGMNDYVRILDNSNLDFGPGQDFSLEAWIKAKPDQALWQGTIMAKLNAPNQPPGSVKRDYGYSLMVRGLKDTSNEGKIGVWLGDGDGTEPLFNLYSIEAYDNDTWHHVVATIDRDGLAILYIDGSEVNNADVSHLSSLDESNNENLEIGREGVYDTYCFNGLIDEVAIYSRALSAEEILQHFQNGLEGLGYEVECTLPPSGILSWWPGNGNTDDFQNSNNGTPINGATFVAGMVDQAFSFDGADDYVDIPDSDSLDTGTQFTIDAWFKTDDVDKVDSGTGSKTQTILMYGWDPADGKNNPLHIRDGKLYVAIRGYGGGFEDIVGVTPINSDTWYHAAVTYDGITATLYLNGAVEYSGTRTMNMNTNSRIMIGRYQNPLNKNYFFAFDGLIDEVELHNRALSQAEIQAIYNAGSAGKCRVRWVAIDIKPGSYPNCFNINGHGVIPVAIIGTADFDPCTEVNPETLKLSGLDVQVRGNNKLMVHCEDVNLDGYPGLVVQFEDDPSRWEPGDSTADLIGELVDGTPIIGSDSICVVQ